MLLLTSSTLLLAGVSSTTAAILGFDRSRYRISLSPLGDKQKSRRTEPGLDLSAFLFELSAFPKLSMSMSMSMSMSYSYPTTPIIDDNETENYAPLGGDSSIKESKIDAQVEFKKKHEDKEEHDSKDGEGHDSNDGEEHNLKDGEEHNSKGGKEHNSKDGEARDIDDPKDSRRPPILFKSDDVVKGSVNSNKEVSRRSCENSSTPQSGTTLFGTVSLLISVETAGEISSMTLSDLNGEILDSMESEILKCHASGQRLPENKLTAQSLSATTTIDEQGMSSNALRLDCLLIT